MPPSAVYRPDPLLSALANSRIQAALDAAWADSTLRKYRGSIHNFLCFCEFENVPPLDCCPASEVLLCAFATSRLGSLAGNTVRNHMSALKVWHAYHNVQWLGGSRLHFVLSGVSNLAPTSSFRPPRPPVSRRMLLVLASHLNLSNSFDACCLAAACTAMWGQLRLGEILSSWENSFQIAHVASRINLSPPINANGSRKLFLPYTKVKKSRGEEVVICRQRDLSDPIHALELHLSLTAFDDNLPLFSYHTSDGLRCLTRTSGSTSRDY